MKMTAKQRKFVVEYVKCGNATQSAIKAGYSEKTARQAGTENLAKPVIKQAIEKEMQKLEDSKIMDAKEAIEILTGIGRGEAKETVVIAAGNEVFTQEKEADLKTRISAIKEILKRYPTLDPMSNAQLEKIKQDTRVSKAKADAIENTGQDTESLLTGYLKELHRGVTDESE